MLQNVEGKKRASKIVQIQFVNMCLLHWVTALPWVLRKEADWPLISHDTVSISNLLSFNLHI